MDLCPLTRAGALCVNRALADASIACRFGSMNCLQRKGSYTMMRTLVLGTALSLLAQGCGADINANTAGYSGPVNIVLDKFKDGDVRNEAFDSDKSINTESGNPYGVFLRDARAVLGRDPAAVVLDRMTFTLASDSRGVTSFEQFLAGTAVIYFSTSSVTVNVGTAVMPTGPGPVSVNITASRADLAPIAEALRSGSFKMGMRVPAAPGRPRSFDARLSTTLYFRALSL